MKNLLKVFKICTLSIILVGGFNLNAHVSAEEVNTENNIAAATQLIEQNPTGLNYFLRAVVYSHNQNYDLAVTDCNHALALGYDNEQVYEVRALSYLNLEKADEAIADCNKILQNNPKNAAALKIRGGAYVLQDDYDSALQDCKSALEIDPNDEELKTQMQEIEQLRAMRNSDPSAKEQDFLAAGINYFKEQQFDKSIVALSKALEINPQNVVALKVRGTAYAVTDDIDNAIADWEKAAELNPSDNSIKEMLQKAYSVKNNQQ